MAEESTGNGAAAPAAAAAAAQVKMSVLAQFVRDMSFENMVAQKGISGSDVQPDIQVGVSLDARKRAAEHQYDVNLKLKVASKNKEIGRASCRERV